LAIFFHDEKIVSNLQGKRAIKAWIKDVLVKEGKSTGQINIVFATDDVLFEINKSFLKREYDTDIITFDYSEGLTISGDLFISLERVNENSKEYGEEKMQELLRVIIHGILHLIGYDDASATEKIRMRDAENKYLNNFTNEG
jgi:probable rRNA maturation factor